MVVVLPVEMFNCVCCHEELYYLKYLQPPIYTLASVAVYMHVHTVCVFCVYVYVHVRCVCVCVCLRVSITEHRLIYTYV